MNGKTTTRRRINTKVVSDIETGRILARKAFDYFGPVEMAMGVRFPSVFSKVIIASPPLAAETSICQTPGFSQSQDGAPVMLFWFVEFTVGTSGTGCTLRVYRNIGAPAVQLNTPVVETVVAGQLISRSGCYIDTPPAQANAQYQITLQIAAGAAPSTVNDVCLLAFSL